MEFPSLLERFHGERKIFHLLSGEWRAERHFPMPNSGLMSHYVMKYYARNPLTREAGFLSSLNAFADFVGSVGWESEQSRFPQLLINKVLDFGSH